MFVLLRYSAILAGFSFCGACQTTPEASPYGISRGYEAYVPARIAVAPCQRWPGVLAGQDQGVAENREKIATLCSQFDRFVIVGFEHQTYLQGLSPQVVHQLFVAAREPQWLDEAGGIWLRALRDCRVNGGVPPRYRQCLASRQEWQLFLAHMSKISRNSDTLLLPLVVEFSEQQEDHRGILHASRHAALALLLIATDSGELLWSGRSTASITNKQPVKNPTPSAAEINPYPPYPQWELVYERLFVPHLWKDFPGRNPGLN